MRPETLALLPLRRRSLYTPFLFARNIPMPRSIIATDKAPAAIGPYSQAVRAGNTVYFSGQIPLDPASGVLVEGDISMQTRRVFDNLVAVAEAAGGSLAQVVRVGIYVTDLANFAAVNAVMGEYFQQPYPARSTIEVSGLPKGAHVEVDAVMVLD
jgi:reactive intermediate/imine deaminase